MSANYQPSAPLHFSDTAQRVLVTGATGFIGQCLVQALLADGHAVTALTRRPSVVDELFSGKVRSITAMEALPVDSRFDAIINLAGARILGWRWTEARKKILCASRIELTHSVVDWIARAQHKPRLLLSASAIGYYGIQAQDDATDLVETSAPQPIFMSQLCQQWEAAATRANEYGVAVNIMRFGVVFGHDGALPMMLLPIKLGMGGKLGSGKQQVSWIHIEDLLRAVAHVYQQHLSATGAQHALADIYNFTAPEVISQWEFARVAATILHRPCVVPTPAFIMRWLLGEQADLLLEGQRVIPHNLRNTGFSFEFPTVSSALTNICK
jgi:uncharacterized protein (TIGR01777 family)